MLVRLENSFTFTILTDPSAEDLPSETHKCGFIQNNFIGEKKNFTTRNFYKNYLKCSGLCLSIKVASSAFSAVAAVHQTWGNTEWIMKVA